MAMKRFFRKLSANVNVLSILLFFVIFYINIIQKYHTTENGYNTENIYETLLTKNETGLNLNSFTLKSNSKGSVATQNAQNIISNETVQAGSRIVRNLIYYGSNLELLSQHGFSK